MIDHFVSTGFTFKGDTGAPVTDADRAAALQAGLFIGPRLNKIFVRISGRQYERMVGYLRKNRCAFQAVGLTTDAEKDYGIALGHPSDWDPVWVES